MSGAGARLFIAINFNYETRSRLVGLRDELRRQSRRGNFSLAENLHLTLVFVGDCDAKQTFAIKIAMDKAVFEPFEMKIGRVGCFRRDGGDIWWAGVDENEPLSSLQQELTESLSGLGFAVDKRKYSPHITLGREVVTEAAPWRIKPFGETVHKINLMKSERVGGKLTYASIY